MCSAVQTKSVGIDRLIDGQSGHIGSAMPVTRARMVIGMRIRHARPTTPRLSLSYQTEFTRWMEFRGRVHSCHRNQRAPGRRKGCQDAQRQWTQFGKPQMQKIPGLTALLNLSQGIQKRQTSREENQTHQTPILSARLRLCRDIQRQQASLERHQVQSKVKIPTPFKRQQDTQRRQASARPQCK